MILFTFVCFFVGFLKDFAQGSARRKELGAGGEYGLDQQRGI
jgi:hypothetical protein